MKPVKKSKGRGHYRMRVAKRRKRQGYDMYDPKTQHWSTVDPVTNVFLKSSDHPSVKEEVNWFKSDDPKAVEWREQYNLVTHTPGGRELKYYKYEKK